MKRVKILSVGSSGEMGQCIPVGRHAHVVVDMKTKEVIERHPDYWSARRAVIARGFVPEDLMGRVQ